MEMIWQRRSHIWQLVLDTEGKWETIKWEVEKLAWDEIIRIDLISKHPFDKTIQDKVGLKTGFRWPALTSLEVWN
jgi:hypothetical protein